MQREYWAARPARLAAAQLPVLVAQWAVERRKAREWVLAREEAGEDASIAAYVASGAVSCGGNAALALLGKLPRKALTTLLAQLYANGR